MTAFDYAKAQATADRLITKFGRLQPITIKRNIAGSTEPPYSPFNPGPPIVISYAARAVVLPASKGTIEAFDNRLESGTLIDEKLRYVIMSAMMTRSSETGPVNIEPRSLDILTFDDIDWTVLGCTPLNPAGVPVYYPMGVQKP